jgi:Flp pilus assembly pilin Flp
MGSAPPVSQGGHMRLLQRWLGLDEGQDLLEYAMLAALIAIAALGAVTVLGDHINRVFWQGIGPSI